MAAQLGDNVNRTVSMTFLMGAELAGEPGSASPLLKDASRCAAKGAGEDGLWALGRAEPLEEPPPDVERDGGSLAGRCGGGLVEARARAFVRCS